MSDGSFSLGSTYVDILPRFGSQWNAQLEAGMRASGQRAGQALNDTFGRSLTSSLSSITGQLSPLSGIFTELFSKVETGFGRMATAAESARGKITGALEAIGVAAVGLGTVLEHLAGPLEKAMADAETAIRNTGNEVDDFTGKFDSAASKMENFGFKSSDTTEALAKLTAASGSPTKALDLLGQTATLAAAKHESLSTAASQVGSAYAGNFKAFREFGIQMTGVANAEAKAESAAKTHATALDNLKTAQQRLADFEERTTAARAAAQEAYDAKVESGNEQIQSTEQALADFRERAAEKYASDVQAANDRVIASETAVADAIRASNSERASANQGLDDALQRLADINAQQQATAAGDPKLAAELSRQAQKRDAETSVTRARARVSDVAVTSSERVSKAQDAEDKAKADQANLIAQGAGGSTSDRQQESRLEAAVSKALENMASIVAKGPGGPGIAAAQEEARLKAEVVKAAQKEAESAKAAADAQADVGANARKVDEALGKVEDKYGGILEARRKTWSGTLDALRTKLEDFFARISGWAAKPLQEFGLPVAVGASLLRGRGGKGVVSGAAEAAGGAEGIAGKVISSGLPATAETLGAEGLGAGAAAGGAEAAAGPLAGLAAAAGPVALVAAAVAAVSVAVYEAYQHIKPFHDAVDAVGRAIKGGFGEAVDFLKKAWDNVLSPVFTGIAHVIGEVATPVFIAFKDIVKIAFAVIVDSIKIPWETIIKPAFTVMSAIVRDVVGPAFSWLGDHVIKPVFGAFSAIVSTEWGIVKGIFEAIDRHIRGPLATAFNFIKSTWDTVWDGVKSVVSTALGVIGNAVGKIIGVVATIAEHIPGADDIGKALRTAQHDVEKLEAGGPVPVGPGFRTRGATAIVGEGNPAYPEYVIATDPKYRDRNKGLFGELASHFMAGGGIVGWVEDKVGAAGSGIASAAGGAVDVVTGALAEVGDVVKAIAEKGARWAVEHAWPKLPTGDNILSVFPAGLNSLRQQVIDFLGGKDTAGAAGGAPLGPPPAGSVTDWLKAAIAATGVPDTWLPGLYAIAIHESSGNPHEINNWDSNAKAGNPSEGLMQTTISTFKGNALPGHGDIWNPVDNAIAAIRYIQGRYHDINRVPGVASLASGGPYKPYRIGGRLGDALSIHERAADDGVVLRPGLNLVPNATGAREALERARDRVEHAGFDSPEVRDLLRELIEAVRAGKEIYVDGERLAQIADRGMHSASMWRA